MMTMPSFLALRTPPSTPDISSADWREEEFTVLNLRIALRTNEPGLADHLRSIFSDQDGVAATVPPGRQDYVVSSVRNQAHQQAYQVATGGRVVLMGVAQSQQEAALALQKIRGIKGVKALVSQLRVMSPKK